MKSKAAEKTNRCNADEAMRLKYCNFFIMFLIVLSGYNSRPDGGVFLGRIVWQNSQRERVTGTCGTVMF
jgi:hypothetical protein